MTLKPEPSPEPGDLEKAWSLLRHEERHPLSMECPTCVRVALALKAAVDDQRERDARFVDKCGEMTIAAAIRSGGSPQPEEDASHKGETMSETFQFRFKIETRAVAVLGEATVAGQPTREKAEAVLRAALGDAPLGDEGGLRIEAADKGEAE